MADRHIFDVVLMDPEETHHVEVYLVDMVASEREMLRRGIATEHKLYMTAMFAWHALRRSVGGMGDFDEFLARVRTLEEGEAPDQESPDPTQTPAPPA